MYTNQDIFNTFRTIGVIYRLTQEHMNQKLKNINLTFLEAMTLSNINNNSLSQKKLAKIIIVDKSQLSKILKKLEEKKYLVRTTGEDKRIKELSLTNSGKEKVKEYDSMVFDWYSSMFSDFKKKEVYFFIEKLNEIYLKIEKR